MIPSLASVVLLTEILVSVAAHKPRLHISLILLISQHHCPCKTLLLLIQIFDCRSDVWQWREGGGKGSMQCTLMGTGTLCSCQHKERKAHLAAAIFGTEGWKINLTPLMCHILLVKV